MNPDRRQFLATAGGALAAVSLPGWIASGRRQAKRAVDDGSPRSEAQAIALAKQRGRPLLVLVLPDEEEGRRYRGRLFGVYINHVEGEAAAELACCDLWCATMDETKRLLPEADLDLLLAFLIEPDGTAPRFIRGPMPPTPARERDRFDGGGETPEQTEERCTTALKAIDAKLASALHAVIAPDDATVGRRAQLERTALEAGPLDDVVATLTDHVEPTPRHAERAPAWLLSRARSTDPDRRAKWHALATSVIARRWRNSPPPCTRWVEAAPCSSVIEYLPGDPDAGDRHGAAYACGMAFVPDYSRRFLVFYLKTGR